MTARDHRRHREVSAGLIEAAHDYRWLLDRGYPDQPAIKLVGDRYQLTGVERAMLFRGVFSDSDSTRRGEMLIPATEWLSGEEADSDRPDESESRFEHLLVDGHNVLFTVSNYLAGRPVVLGTDGIIRDIGGTHTRLPRDERFSRIADILCRTLAASRFRRLTILLDAPLPWSREHRRILLERWHSVTAVKTFEVDVSPQPTPEVLLEEHVDRTVAAIQDSAVATSDTGILNRCQAPVADVGGTIVRETFDAALVELLPGATT
ncbi:MAG: DUF434 domain-containing protein [Spirochaetales bacterium]